MKCNVRINLLSFSNEENIAGYNFGIGNSMRKYFGK